MKKKMYIMLLLTVVAGRMTVSAQQQNTIDSITGRLAASYISAGYSNPATLMGSMQSNGSWTDIDYQDTHSNQGGWSPNKHFKNLRAMAVAYRHVSSPYYLDENLKNKIIAGCNFVYSWSYPKDADNWWYNDIGDPEEYKVALLLMKGYIPTTDLKKYSAFIRDLTGNAGHKGKNRTWVSSITIHKACIEDNYSLLDKGFKSMAMPLVIVPVQGDEGIKIDGSFHQHHPQLYSGGYGLSIVGDITTYMLLCKGTPLESSFNNTHREIFSNLMLRGHLHLGYRKYMDFGSRGRNITRAGGAYVPEEDLERMTTIDPANSAKYAAWKEHLNGAPFPEPGNRHFWKSDIMTHHGENYYLSAKVISTRTNGTEMINGENTKGYNLPLGATNILTHGDEYNDIFPIWDWTRIPGTTAAANQAYAELGGYHYGTNAFGGGVSSGKSGIIAYQHDYKELKANKACFFIGDAMLCVGSGITATHSYPIVTSVNQCFLKGVPRIFEESAAGETLVTSSKTSDNILWAHHDNVGYIFLEKNNMTVQGVSQSGSWKSINNTGSSTAITNKVFSIMVNHGTAPLNKTYQYLVVPDKTLAQFKPIASNHGFVVVKNDDKVQAVRNDLLNCFAIVYYSSGTVNLGNGLSVYANTSSLVLIEKNGAEYKISVADPTYSKTKLSLTINKTLQGDNAAINGAGTATQIMFDLPSGDYQGSSITKTFTDPSEQSGAESLSASEFDNAYPNPVSDVLYIKNGNLAIHKVSVTNTIGKTVFSETVAAPTVEIFTKDWEAGIYFLTVEKDDKFYSQKIIKTNGQKSGL